ncbi:L,D-transpeptidase family protein [Limosilactobacillus caecicola]|uniref:L,D-transpeptidase family protein n=1 Tax=Limosilactobacillus caecicola TaxID=2941332 RepID=UPI0020410C18|nr:L,D-transpeptidase family protein [Limosilactobacillus caecicola]
MNKTGKIVSGIIAAVVIIVGGSYWYQSTHFNKNTKVNGVAVGGMTAKAAYQKVSQQKLTHRVYLNGKLIYSGRSSKAGYTQSDESKFKSAIKRQRTLFPSSKQRNLKITPSNKDGQQVAAIKSAVQQKIKALNTSRTAPVNAKVVWQNGKVTTTKPKKGNQYDVKRLMKQYDQNAYAPTIRLSKLYTQPLGASSSAIQKQKAKMSKLNKRSVTYVVENSKYKLKSKDVLTKVTWEDGHYTFDTSALKSKINSINKAKATLGKSFKFKTHSGKVIQTAKGGSYGWKLSETKAGKTLGNALLNGKSTVSAKNDIYGTGYYTGGLGYGVTKNYGLGDTYAEVSIADQHAWFYKNGKLVYSADVVTGKQSSGDATPKGVWYIMYQQSPSVLRGTGDSGKAYTQPVSYWSAFTNSGVGFHDASWRTNWSKTAYISDGSNGCVNMHPSDAGAAYKAIVVHEPVIVY